MENITSMMTTLSFSPSNQQTLLLYNLNDHYHSIQIEMGNIKAFLFTDWFCWSGQQLLIYTREKRFTSDDHKSLNFYKIYLSISKLSSNAEWKEYNAMLWISFRLMRWGMHLVRHTCYPNAYQIIILGYLIMIYNWLYYDIEMDVYKWHYFWHKSNYPYDAPMYYRWWHSHPLWTKWYEIRDTFKCVLQQYIK